MEQFWKDNHFAVRWNTIPEAVRWRGEWRDFRRLQLNKALRYLILWHHKTEDGDIGNIELPAQLQYLQLNWSNATNVGQAPKGLRRLEMHYCTKLETASEIATSCPELRHLHFNQSKKFQDVASLLPLKKLEVLCLNNCGPLPDLSFLAGFKKLRDFRFVNTNVVDGDLAPILAHPKLVYVGTLDKRHYSHKSDEITALLAARAPAQR